MFKNYVKVSLRNLAKNKIYSVINILGLSVGISCFVILMLWVIDEGSYDAFHKNSSNIYRTVLVDKSSNVETKYAITSAPVGPAIVEEFPEIINQVRIIKPAGRQALIENKKENKVFYEADMAWADNEYFDVFSVKMLLGNPGTALKQPNQLVISESIAQKYFGEEDPIGKSLSVTLRIGPKTEYADYVVSGVMEDSPKNSHIRINLLGSINSLERTLPGHAENWNLHAYFTYLLLNNNANIESLQSKMPEFLSKHFDEETAKSLGIFLQPLTDIHLTNNILFEPSPTGNKSYLFILAVVAVSILLIAAVNYMNLATAKSAGRAKEVGIKKVLGAQKNSLVSQFLTESIIIGMAGLFVALFLIELSLPIFNDIAGKQLSVGYLTNAIVIPILLIITLLIGIISGSYPAFYLSSLLPSKVLKGKLSSASRNVILRKVLIVSQFTVTIIMLIGTGIVYDQLDFFRNKNLGFDKDNVLVITLNSDEEGFNENTFREELITNPYINNAALSSSVPGRNTSRYSIRYENQSDSEVQTLKTIEIDENFIETLKIDLAAGRNYSKNFISDSTSFIINESAVNLYGLSSAKDALGKTLEVVEMGKSGQVVGVVKDFHFNSLHQDIEPTVFHMNPRSYSFFLVQLNSDNVFNTIDFIESKWKEFVPANPIEYYFLDEKFNQLYLSEVRLGKIFIFFSIIAIFVGCLGLFGLASFMAEQRRKEIGIRKVLGATESKIVQLISKDFTLLLIVSNIIAWPVAFYAMEQWLNNFAYRIDIDFMPFVVSAAVTIIFALTTVSYQAFRAAKTNPINTLRAE